ncbi:hypothetical protein SBDP1_1640015 [Syntrophobacter sp. SbD1]|nr:hypothetical protein SBDP1_1640015 [Syntrophobacter sp. SbD1]
MPIECIGMVVVRLDGKGGELIENRQVKQTFWGTSLGPAVLWFAWTGFFRPAFNRKQA